MDVNRGLGILCALVSMIRTTRSRGDFSKYYVPSRSWNASHKIRVRISEDCSRICLSCYLHFKVQNKTFFLLILVLATTTALPISSSHKTRCSLTMAQVDMTSQFSSEAAAGGMGGPPGGPPGDGRKPPQGQSKPLTILL